MNLALRLTKQQMLILAIIFVALLVTVLFVIHSAVPSLWHTIAYKPDMPFWGP